MSIPFALLAARVGRISRAGAMAGTACSALIYAAFYLAGLAVLGVGLMLTIGASRIGGARRRRDTVHEDDRRGAANIIANCGVGTLGAVAELLDLGFPLELTALWCVTGIAAGASDTVASEIGKAFGGQPRAFPTWRVVAPGTPGAVSGVGTVAGIVAAALIALPAPALWLLPWSSLSLVMLCCTVGAFIESTLATRYEENGRIDNHALNAINTLVASLMAVALAIYSRA